MRAMPHGITGPRGRVSIPELPIGNKKPNQISMILRKIQTYNHKCHLMKLGISIEIIGYLISRI